jgi:AcrR family transcriptional regulator
MPDSVSPALEDSVETKRAAARGKARPKKKRRNYLPAAERKRRIIRAAQKVFAGASLKGARTRDLAKAADINQATLFEHFASKEELFVAAVVQPLLDAMRGMRERAQAYEAAPSPGEMLALAEASCQKHLEAMVQIYPLLVAALFSDPALGRKLYRQQIVPLLKDRADAMRATVRDTIDPELLALANFGVFFAVAMDRAFKKKNGDLSALARQITNLAAFGFARVRGKR